MKVRVLPVGLTSVSVILAALLCEATLRLTGYMPWTYTNKDANEPTMHEADPVLGWKNKEGKYVIPAYAPSGQDIHMTFIGNGQRYTGLKGTDLRKDFVIVGGSYTLGWAIDDSETYPWKLQERYPALNVLNYGTAGYGGYQSLLVLEKELPRLTSPIIVLYGFNDHHKTRNVATSGWMQTLSKFSRRGHVFVPYVTFEENNGLIRHMPERYLELPYRESSATIAMIEKVYMKIKTMNRSSQERLVADQILLEMNRISERSGAQFVMAILRANREDKVHYMNFCRAHDISCIDCVYPLTPDMRVAGEGHPNELANSLWANCIANELGIHTTIQD